MYGVRDNGSCADIDRENLLKSKKTTPPKRKGPVGPVSAWRLAPAKMVWWYSILCVLQWVLMCSGVGLTFNQPLWEPTVAKLVLCNADLPTSGDCIPNIHARARRPIKIKQLPARRCWPAAHGQPPRSLLFGLLVLIYNYPQSLN